MNGSIEFQTGKWKKNHNCKNARGICELHIVLFFFRATKYTPTAIFCPPVPESNSISSILILLGKMARKIINNSLTWTHFCFPCCIFHCQLLKSMSNSILDSTISIGYLFFFEFCPAPEWNWLEFVLSCFVFFFAFEKPIHNQ